MGRGTGNAEIFFPRLHMAFMSYVIGEMSARWSSSGRSEQQKFRLSRVGVCDFQVDLFSGLGALAASSPRPRRAWFDARPSTCPVSRARACAPPQNPPPGHTETP